MKIKYIILASLIVFAFSACQECKDCQSSSDITLTKEFYAIDTTGSYSLDSTSVRTYTSVGKFAEPENPSDSLPLFISPISIFEFCGSELDDVDGNSIVYEVILGDTIVGLYKYSWTEAWDCK